jgi:hypothetical protein
VLEGFAPAFSEASDRFPDRELLLRRFNEAVDSVRFGRPILGGLHHEYRLEKVAA